MPVPRDVRSHPAPPSVRQTSAANPRTRVPSPAHRSHPVAARFAPSADRHSAEHRPRQPSESTAPAPSSPQSEKRKDQPDCRASRRLQPGAAPIDSNANPTPSSSMHPNRCELHTHQDYAKPATKSKNGPWTASPKQQSYSNLQRVASSPRQIPLANCSPPAAALPAHRPASSGVTPQSLRQLHQKKLGDHNRRQAVSRSRSLPRSTSARNHAPHCPDPPLQTSPLPQQPAPPARHVHSPP